MQLVEQDVDKKKWLSCESIWMLIVLLSLVGWIAEDRIGDSS